MNTLVAGLARGEASVVVPISNLGFLSALVIAVAVGWEGMTVRKGLAVGAAVVAIALLAHQG